MMDYEQKYKEALKTIESLYNTVKYQSSTDALLTSQTIEKAFPELRESEDERIKRCIQVALTDVDEKRFIDYDTTLKDCLAWLEKQGEQKPTIFIPKFRVGDKLVSTKNPRLTYEVLEVGNINELGNPEYKVEIFTDRKVSNPRNIHDMECYKVDEWAKLIEQNPDELPKED